MAMSTRSETNTGTPCRSMPVKAQAARRQGRDYEPQDLRELSRLSVIGPDFPGGLQFELWTSDRSSRGGDLCAHRDGHHNVWGAADGDGDGRTEPPRGRGGGGVRR